MQLLRVQDHTMIGQAVQGLSRVRVQFAPLPLPPQGPP